MNNLMFPRKGLGSPGIEGSRLAESQQILPLIGTRKPASDRGHWLQPAPCSSRRRSCPGGERGDGQSSVPVEPTRHGHRNRREDRRVRLQNRVVSTTVRRTARAISRNSEFQIFRESRNTGFCITKNGGSSGTGVGL